MKLELVIFGITAFLIFNTYHNGKYLKLILSYKKYYTMAFIAILGISFYLLMKRNPSKCKNILLHANNMIKYMPIDKSSMDMISPIIDFTNIDNNDGGTGGSFMGNLNATNPSNPYERKILQSGGATGTPGKATKRSVSETKKKYVASCQNWKCGNCKQQLSAWFEVDHVVRLEHGGSNEVQNLIALCRECHGQKTAMENM
jgi:hypothetical protein